VGLAQRGGPEVGVLGILPAAGKRDLAGVPAQVGPATGQDDVGLVGGEEQRDEDGRVGAAVDVQGCGLDGVEEDLRELLAQVSARA
jgi:hypothetical protein